MERITKEKIEKFISQNAIELECTQSRMSVPVIDRIYRKMCLGIKFSGIKVEENLICDGHHRYLASLFANSAIERFPSLKTSATVLIKWQSVFFEENDWDTAAKIDMLNEQDARYNNIPIEKLVELLK